MVSDSVIPGVQSKDESGIPKAVAMATAADTVILAVGTDLGWSSEGHDAETITFTDAQLAMVEQVAAAAKKPVVVVICTATPLDISAFLANPKVSSQFTHVFDCRLETLTVATKTSNRKKVHNLCFCSRHDTHAQTYRPLILHRKKKVGAIIHTGQPSVTIYGIAELLYGKVSPAGRTIQTIYPASYQDQISIFDFNMRPGPSPFVRPDCNASCPAVRTPWDPRMHGGPCGDCPMGTNPGRTHRFYVDKPVVPFGFGLSYTTFT